MTFYRRLTTILSVASVFLHSTDAFVPVSKSTQLPTHVLKDLIKQQSTKLQAIPSSSSSTNSGPFTSLEQSILQSNWKPPGTMKFAGVRRAPGRTSISTSSSTTTTSTSLPVMSGAVMPDGGLSPCVIKVIGVGGGGSNAVDRMMDTRVGGVEFWCVNTDAQALGRSKARGAKVLNIGSQVTRGLGAGGSPKVGEQAAEESRADIATMLKGSDLVFVTSGMGGGTGSGAAPVVAEVAKEAGALTIGIVTKPFDFEGRRRMNQALDAIERLKKNVDTVIVVSNNKLLEIIPDDTPIERAFAVADDILRQGVVGIADIIIKPGMVNVDFADVRTVMNNAGTALMGIGVGSGKTRAEDAAAAAISSPLLDNTIDHATGVVFTLSGGPNMSLSEVSRAAKLIYDNVEKDANVIFGALIDDSLGETVSMTVLATGFHSSQERFRSTIQSPASAPSKKKTSVAPAVSWSGAPSKAIENVREKEKVNDGFGTSKVTNNNVKPINSSSSPPPPPRQTNSANISQSSKKKSDDIPASQKKESSDDVPDFLKGLKRRR